MKCGTAVAFDGAIIVVALSVLVRSEVLLGVSTKSGMFWRCDVI
jgi:hypothetical protein